MINFDLISRVIGKYLSIYDIKKLLVINGDFWSNMYIMSYNAFDGLSQDIINLHIFRYIEKLDLGKYTNIKDLNHLTSLRKLCIDHNYQITPASMFQLKNLSTLKITYNSNFGNIGDFAMFNNLRELEFDGLSCITQRQIVLVKNVVKLTLRSTDYVTDLNHMTKLRDLKLSNTCGVKDKGIKSLTNIIRLYLFNVRITDINHMIKIRFLTLYDRGNEIRQENISNLVNVETLNISYSKNINDLNHMTKLKKLFMQCNESVTQDGISKLMNLIYLNIYNNELIYDLNHLINLKSLIIGNNSNLTNESIRSLINLKILKLNNTPNITDVNHMVNLETLDIWGERCGVDQDGIRNLRNIRHLDINGNNKITSVSHLKDLRSLDMRSNIYVKDTIADLIHLKDIKS